MRGYFITFEGIEGSGKSTQVAMLKKKLEDRGVPTLCVREPGGTPVGQHVRKILLNPETGDLDPLTELLLFWAARRELVKNVITPALEQGQTIVCDRFADSTTAYQGYGRGVDMEIIDTMAKIMRNGVWPDRTIILDLPAGAGLNRALDRIMFKGSTDTRFEDEGLEFHRRVRNGFLKIAESNPDRVKIVNAEGSLEEVSEAVAGALEDILPELSNPC